MSHKHHSCQCEHANVKYCKTCNLVYCLDCNFEWKNSFGRSWSYPYQITYGSDLYTNYQATQSAGRATLTTTDNQLHDGHSLIVSHDHGAK